MVHDHNLMNKKHFGPFAEKLVTIIQKLIAEGERRQEEKNKRAKAERELLIKET